MAAYELNIGGVETQDYALNIGYDQALGAILLVGTCAGLSDGDIGVLLRDVFFSGTAAGDSTGSSGVITNLVFLIGTDLGQGRGSSPGLIKDVSMSGTATGISAGSAVPNIWQALSYVLNDTDYRIELAYDPDNLGILITRTDTQNLSNDNIWYDLRTKGFYPETYQKDLRAYSTLFYPHAYRSYRGMLVGGSDGYIHVFSRHAKNDHGLNVDEAVDSYMYSPPIMLGPEDREGKLTSLAFYLGGRALGSDAVASDGMSYDIYVGDSIEECYEQIVDGTTPAETGTVTTAGRAVRQRTVCRGAYAVIKMYNSTTSETWALNKVLGTVTPAGRIR